jgi:hypothetical protein
MKGVVLAAAGRRARRRPCEIRAGAGDVDAGCSGVAVGAKATSMWQLDPAASAVGQSVPAIVKSAGSYCASSPGIARIEKVRVLAALVAVSVNRRVALVPPAVWSQNVNAGPSAQPEGAGGAVIVKPLDPPAAATVAPRFFRPTANTTTIAIVAAPITSNRRTRLSLSVLSFDAFGFTSGRSGCVASGRSYQRRATGD